MTLKHVFRWTASVLAAAGVVALLPAGSTAADGEQLTVACANTALTRVQFKLTPRQCAFLAKGESSAVEAAFGKKLKWRHWGDPHATAKGNGFLNMLGRTPIKVTLSKPQDGCAGRVYSKVKIRYPEVNLGGDYRLDTCRR